MSYPQTLKVDIIVRISICTPNEVDNSFTEDIQLTTLSFIWRNDTEQLQYLRGPYGQSTSGTSS